MNNAVHLIDCMEFMKTVPDKYYELAIVDPPYGIGEDGGRFRGRKGGGHRIHIKKEWDNKTPDILYFNELSRISQNQIIWGAIYFTNYLQQSRGWIYWNKMMGGDFSDGDLAWTSFDKPLKSFTFCNKYHGQIHPTQKPVALYKWLLTNYAKPHDKIFDSHVGSGSSRIACYDLGFDFEGCELDADYWQGQEDRFKTHINQQSLFDTQEIQGLIYDQH